MCWLLSAAAACTPGGGGDLEPWDDLGTSDELYDGTTIRELELVLDDDAIASLAARPREYVRATLVAGGVRYGPVGVKLKGRSSFRPLSEKPSFRIKIDAYIDDVTFFDLEDLTFNSMVGDPSQMHEVLAYRVAREAGLVASRTNHIELTVNGEPYGLYANVETVKPRMLGRHFADKDGPLFEATDVDLVAADIDTFELKAGPDDRSLLRGVANALLRTPAASALSAVDPYLAVAHFQQYWAVATVIGQFDAFPYSNPGDDYFLYADPRAGQLAILPWGMDETFFAADVSPLSVHSILATTCLASSTCFDGYVDQVWEIQTLCESLDLEGERVRIQAEIQPHVERDQRRPYSEAEVAEGQLQLGYFIRGRREVLGSYLPPR